MRKFVMAAFGGTLAGVLVTTQVAGPLLAQEANKPKSLYEQLDHTELKLTIYAASREKNGLLAQFTSEE